MIPKENLAMFTRRLKEGWTIRNACNDAKISRPNLYAHFKEFPEFKEKSEKIIERYSTNQKKLTMLSARRGLMKRKEMVRKMKA